MSRVAAAPFVRATAARRGAVAGLLLLAAALLAASCGDDATPIEDRFAVDGSVLLSIVVDDGDVTVEAGVDGTVIVTGGIDPDRYGYERINGGGIVRLELRRTRSLFTLLGGGGASLRVVAPSGTLLDVTVSNGTVTITGPLAGGRLETTNAAVEVTGVDGGLVVSASNGSVRVAEQRGDLTVSLSNGNVVVLDHGDGTVNLETDNGFIEYAGTIEPGVANELVTANGSIVITLAGSPSLMLDASTSNGVVTSRYAVLDAERTATALRGRIAGGEATLRLRAANGSIELR